MCGLCTDAIIELGFPFMPYVGLVFVSQSLVVGNVVCLMSKDRDVINDVKPIRYFLLFIVFLIGSVFIAMGSLMLPLMLILAIWGRYLLQRLRSPQMALKRQSQITLCLIALLIPVSYALPFRLFQTHHETSREAWRQEQQALQEQQQASPINETTAESTTGKSNKPPAKQAKVGHDIP